MSTTDTTTITSLDGFHATPTAQRADELARAFFDAVNADDPARTDAVLARSFLSYDVHARTAGQPGGWQAGPRLTDCEPAYS